MATFPPTPFGALAASAQDLPASFNAASAACCHRAHLISAISVADISGDNARWAGWRALAVTGALRGGNGESNAGGNVLDNQH